MQLAPLTAVTAEGQKRKGNWLDLLRQFSRETESPVSFWLWSGISTIASALQRKVWLPFGMDAIYPNQYIFLIGPPATRKANPIKFSRKILDAVGVDVGVDSQSKRSLTQDLAELAKTRFYNYEGRVVPMAPLSLVSPELSTLFHLDINAIVEALTDIYDNSDKWDYKTSGSGKDVLRNVCLNVFAATTPSWFMNNMPPAAIGDGFTSRVVVVYEEERAHWVPLPPEPDWELYKVLMAELKKIKRLVGPFTWDPKALEMHNKWYRSLKGRMLRVHDERLHSFVGRIQGHMLKTAMALRVAYSNELVLTTDDIQLAVELLEEVLDAAPKAFTVLGGNDFAKVTHIILRQVATLKETTFKELLRMNLQRGMTKQSLTEVLDTLESTGVVERVTASAGGLAKQQIRYNAKEGRRC